MSIVAIIPARGGSKGIKRKNLALLNGKPLISYTIEAALKCKQIDRVIVSTDDLEIASVAKKMGCEVPFTRPKYLSEDHTPMIDVLKHALSWFESEQYPVNTLVLLQPTSPLRTSKHIEEAITIYKENKPCTLVSVMKIPHQFNPTSILQRNDDGSMVLFLEQPLILRRQDKPVYFARNGPAILIAKPNMIQKEILYGNPTYGYQMDDISSLDIDNDLDLAFADFLIGMEKIQAFN